MTGFARTVASDSEGSNREDPPVEPDALVSLRACPGDCNDNNAVAIEELISGVNIALNRVPLAQCTAVDSDGNEVVAVNELVQAVNAALHGCG